mgnify:FL=1
MFNHPAEVGTTQSIECGIRLSADTALFILVLFSLGFVLFEYS